MSPAGPVRVATHFVDRLDLTNPVLHAPPLWRPTLWPLCLFGAAYVAGAELGHFLAFQDAATGQPAYWPIWPPAGLLLGALLVSERSCWARLLLVTLPASLVSDVALRGESFAGASAFWLANAAGPWVGACLLRNRLPDRLDVQNLRHLFALLLWGGVVAPAGGATLGAASVTVFDGQPPFLQAWLQWWVGDALGVLVFAPVVVLCVLPGDSPRIRRRRWGYLLEFAVFCAALAWLSDLVFHRPPDEAGLIARFPFFVLTPVLLWAGYRFEPRATSLCVVLLALIVVWCTTRGFGAIVRFGDSLTMQAVLLQTMLALVMCLTLLFSTSIERREQSEERLRRETEALALVESEVRGRRDLLQSILDSMGEAVIVADLSGHFVLRNPAALAFQGEQAPATSLEDTPRHWQVFRADGVTPLPPEEWPLARALRGESFDGEQIAVQRWHDQRPAHLRVTGRPLRGADGAPLGGVVVFSDISSLREAEREQTQLINRLQQALQEVRTLRGMIPICSGCRKIRNDEGAWERLESYVSAHTQAEFTHGFCPECSRVLYGEVAYDPSEGDSPRAWKPAQ